MAKNRTTGQETDWDDKKVLQKMHDQGLIDLDAPMRQLFDKIEASGDVRGYQSFEPYEGDAWWLLKKVDKSPDGTTTTKVFYGDGLKDDGGLR